MVEGSLFDIIDWLQGAELIPLYFIWRVGGWLSQKFEGSLFDIIDLLQGAELIPLYYIWRVGGWLLHSFLKTNFSGYFFLI